MWLWGACVVAGEACIGYDEIRSMSGRYASYWNAILFFGKMHEISKKIELRAVANPGFPRRRTYQSKGVGANPLFWPFFPENCMKLKKKWTKKEGSHL